MYQDIEKVRRRRKIQILIFEFWSRLSLTLSHFLARWPQKVFLSHLAAQSASSSLSPSWWSFKRVSYDLGSVGQSNLLV